MENFYSDSKGFLISNLIPYIEKSNITNIFFHFGCPSCKERFISKENLYNKMIVSTKDVIEFCLEKNLKLVYASSEGSGVKDSHFLQNLYNQYKKECEDLIINSGLEFLILRIPRVYGNINKGILNLNIIDNPLKPLNYLDINDFVNQTINKLHLSGIIKYNTSKNNLRDIILKYKFNIS